MAQSDQVALLACGGDHVIGSITRELARRKWKVVAGAPADHDLRSAQRLAESAGGNITTLACDLTTAEGREKLVDLALDESDHLDLLVVGPLSHAPSEELLELTDGSLQQALRECLEAPLFLAQLVANEMVRLAEADLIEGGKIVFLNSMGAYTSGVSRPAHCLTSSAAAMMTTLFADALGEHGINVYEIRSGLLAGGTMPAETQAKYEKLIEGGLTPLRRWGRADDIALAVAAVAEDLLPFSTGEVINVDGGFHLRRL